MNNIRYHKSLGTSVINSPMPASILALGLTFKQRFWNVQVDNLGKIQIFCFSSLFLSQILVLRNQISSFDPRLIFLTGLERSGIPSPKKTALNHHRTSKNSTYLNRQNSLLQNENSYFSHRIINGFPRI